MAQTLPYKFTRFNGVDNDTLHPETSYNLLTDIPSTFPPTYHTHVLADITDLSAGTLVEATAGTVTEQRSWSPSILKQAIESLSDLNTNNYLTGLSFNTTDGVLTATRSGLSNLTVDLDGRYSLNTHTHSLNQITSPTGNTTWSMGGNTLTYNFTNPVGGMLLNMTGGWSGHTFEILDTSTVPDGTIGDHLMHLETSRVNVIPLHTVQNDVNGTSLLVDGKSIFNGNGEFSGNVKVGNSNTLSNEGFELNGTASVGLRATNANGYVSLTPLNSGWAHIYTDRSNFIFNKPVYSLDDIFSSYDADLQLRRIGVTKLTLGDTVSTFANNLQVNGTTNLSNRLTVDYSATGGDSTWDDSGILIKNNNATAAETALAMQTSATGADYWIQGLNQSADYKFAYGNAFVDGNVKLTLTSSGALTLTGTVTAPTFSGSLSGNASSASTATTLTGLTASIAELNFTDGVTSNIQTQLNTKAPLNSPSLTGTPTAPTATAGTNTTQIATTAFVGTAISNLVDSSPATLDTLNELAAALGDDPNFATTVSTEIGTKVSKSGDTMTGGLTAPNIYVTTDLHVDSIRARTGSQLAVSAGETYAQLSTANIGTSEILWIGGESGVNVVSSPDNWATGFAGRYQATLLNSSGNTSFPGTVTAPTFSGSLSGNASTASSAAKLTTARTISLTGDVSGSTSFDGTGNVSITAVVADDSHNHIISNVDGLQTALDGKLSTSGVAAAATKLDVARNINGTAFDGTASITTSFWGTTRTITIGSTGKSVNGSGNYSWSLAEIGAQAAGTYNTIIGTDSDVSVSTGSSVLSTLNMTDGVITSHTTRNLDAVRGQDGVDMKFWKGTQAAYNAIGTKDSNTVYFVTG